MPYLGWSIAHEGLVGFVVPGVVVRRLLMLILDVVPISPWLLLLLLLLLTKHRPSLLVIGDICQLY